MKKRTYKRMQNRLYREIKRRILAEQLMMKPVKYDVCERKINTLAICRSIRQWERDIPIEYVQKDLAHCLANKLRESGYIEYCTGPEMQDRVDIVARLDVVMPRKQW